MNRFFFPHHCLTRKLVLPRASPCKCHPLLCSVLPLPLPLSLPSLSLPLSLPPPPLPLSLPLTWSTSNGITSVAVPRLLMNMEGGNDMTASPSAMPRAATTAISRLRCGARSVGPTVDPWRRQRGEGKHATVQWSGAWCTVTWHNRRDATEVLVQDWSEMTDTDQEHSINVLP